MPAVLCLDNTHRQSDNSLVSSKMKLREEGEGRVQLCKSPAVGEMATRRPRRQCIKAVQRILFYISQRVFLWGFRGRAAVTTLRTSNPLQTPPYQCPLQPCAMPRRISRLYIFIFNKTTLQTVPFVKKNTRRSHYDAEESSSVEGVAWDESARPNTTSEANGKVTTLLRYIGPRFCAQGAERKFRGMEVYDILTCRNSFGSQEPRNFRV